MRKNTILPLAYGLGAVITPSAILQAQQNADKPNIVLILLDDVGYSDFGCYGSEIETPNIDRLAENGIRLRHFYNQARSAPTRASLLTGLYPHQVGNGALGKVPGYDAYQGYPNEENAFIPEVLKSAGYFSVMTGKWHLGYYQGVTPIKRGFDRSLNAPVGGFYFSTDVRPKRAQSNTLFLNDEKMDFDDPRLPENWYSTHLWTQFGLQFIDEAIEKGQPFFWYLAHNGAHFPLQAPEKTIDKYKGKYMKGWEEVRNARFQKQLESGLFENPGQLTPRNPKSPEWDSLTQEEKERYDLQMAIYAAVMDEIDQSIGKVVDHLKEKGVLENTLIILLSDNGGNGEPGMEGRFEGKIPGSAKSTVFLGASWADVANTPFFLYKHHGHEGGCNTPFIVSYPKGIDKNLNGSIRKDCYGHVIDIMPTLVELTAAVYPSARDGHAVPPMEGISLLPLFKGEPVKAIPTIVEHEGNKMLRDGDWKIVQENREPEWMLYNLKTDPTEMKNLAGKEPEMLKSMIDKYRKMADRTGVEGEIQFKTGKWYTPVEEYFK
ncbi:MAG: arylsulfatase [Tannerella sp.]|jgi:arylsulfatase|nr:arylsulfatase [Tannerella sp.]